MQRQESERSTRYPVRSIWHLRCQKSWIWWKIPTSRRDDESGKRSSSNLPDRLSVSSQPTIRSPTFSISLAITSLPPNTELPGCKHSGCGRKLAAELPLRYKSPTCLPSRGKSGRTSRRCPIASSCTPLSTKMKGCDFRHRQRRCFGETRRTLRCVAVPLRETPTGRRPSTTASNMGCLAGSAGLRKRRDYLISAQAYALISSPTAISMITGVFHFIAVFLDLILAGGKSRVAAKRRRIRQT